jgi:hypothetical protein
MTKDRTRMGRWGRWLATFIGFPLSGLAARAVVGNIDDTASAALGGLACGAVLGAVQATVGGIDRPLRMRWITGTAVGMAAGLAIGAGVVDFRTDTASLVVMGALSGAGVGLGQAISIPMSTVDRVLWATFQPALWAGGWSISSQVIVDADRQHAIYGGPACLAVSAVLGLLHLRRTDRLLRPLAAGSLEVVA